LFGVVVPAGQLNGSSRRWLRERVLMPLGARADEAWITDCLDTYRASEGQRRRIADAYDPIAEKVGLSTAKLADHPDENQIVREALNGQRPRLLRELEVVSPDLIVTFGRAAARVLGALPEFEGEAELSPRFPHFAKTFRPI
jgi:hypothetical protein